LVLETDGATEEVTFWFKAGANVGGPAATHAAAAHVASGKRRRERARRRRRREERRREAEGNLLPPGPPTAGGNTAVVDSPPAPPREASPSTATTVRARGYKARPLVVKRTKAALAASRASQRAAALAKRRGAAATQLSAFQAKLHQKNYGGLMKTSPSTSRTRRERMEGSHPWTRRQKAKKSCTRATFAHAYQCHHRKLQKCKIFCMPGQLVDTMRRNWRRV